ncbi:MAG: T9SS type A sorting domain-containing protein [Saprospiraceae bacterium]|nr:T9SS type A sorting domain-containing protein [Saprospiraceae bacterium]
MKNNFTSLVKSLIFILCFSSISIVQAQDSLQLNLVSLQNLVAENQTNYTVDVTVKDFNDLLASQFMINWDPNVLTIESIPYVTDQLGGFDQFSIAIPSETYEMIPGRVTVAWTSNSGTKQSLPDDTKLFTMNFTVVGIPCSWTGLNLYETSGFGLEAIDDDFINLGIKMEEFPVEVAGPGCSQFSSALACNDKVDITIYPGETEQPVFPSDFLEGGPYNYSNMMVSPTSVSCNEVGEIITYTVTDVVNDNSCWGYINVLGPNCGEFITNLACNDDVYFSLNPNLTDTPISADAILEGGPYNYSNMVVAPATVSCEDLGNTIKVTVTDQTTGNACWGQLTVFGPHCENFNSTLVCTDKINVSIPPWGGGATLTPEMLLEGGPYNYSEMTVFPEKVYCDDIGTSVFATVTDNTTGNSCWSEIITEDKLAPVAIAKANIVVALSDDGSASPYTAKLYAQSVDNGSHDNCTPVSFSPEFWEFDCSDLGENTITLEVIDDYGNVGTVWTDVTVELKGTHTLSCPEDIVINCDIDIEDDEMLENILGQATIGDNCAVRYTDTYGFDANNDGDLNDTYILNGEEINESFSACTEGTILRTWSLTGSANKCEQVIGVLGNDFVFDGTTMIDWPYSKNAIIDLEDNDSGASCDSSCGLIDPDDITLDYDGDGNLRSVTIVNTCEVNLCEEPYFALGGCSLVGYSVEKDYFNIGNGDLRILLHYTVIDWCQFDPNLPDAGGIWEYTVNAYITGGASSVNLFTGDVSGNKGESVCVPVKVSNFNDIESFQGSLNWDPTIAQFDKVSNFNLPGLNSSSFGLNNSDNGKLSFIWIDNTGTTPITLTDNQKVFDVCYNVIGDSGESTAVAFSNDPTNLEASSNLQQLQITTSNGSITVGSSNCANDTKSPTPYCLNLSTAVMSSNSVGENSVELWAIDFNAGSFDNCTSEENLRYTFSNVNPDLDASFDTRSSSKVYKASDFGNASSIQITEKIYVWDENDNYDFCQVTLKLVNPEGSTDDDTVVFKFGDHAVVPGSSICVPLVVQNFSNIETFQGSVSWDPNVVSYKNVQNFNAPGLSAASFGETGVDNGTLPFVWFDGTGSTPLTLPDNSTLFEVCFDAVASAGTSSFVKVVDDANVRVEVTKPSPIGVVDHISLFGSISIIDGNCPFSADDIIWPTAELNVNTPSTNLSPDDLLLIAGIEITDVQPTYIITTECEGFVFHTYSDQVFNEAAGKVKILRTWTVLDWFSGQTFSFVQTIRNYIDGNLICDFLPNSAPFGDCDSGHTSSDDVEWPDDLFIADHRITPAELVATSGVDVEDSKPIFYNVPDVYNATYQDFIGILSQTNLVIDRVWTVTRSDLAGKTWTYTQVIDVDLEQFGNLVTVNTISARPVPDVSLNASDQTNLEGLAYVEGSVDPTKEDVLRNGLNIKDLMMIQANVLNQLELNQFEEMAADVNGDNSITAIDVFELESILLGLSGEEMTDWMFSDVTSEIESGVEPKGHYIAVKAGDVDDSADLGFGSPAYETETLIIQDQLLNQGEKYFVPLYVGNDIEALGTELNLTFDNDVVEITKVTSDQVFGSISFNIINDNRIAMITENFDLSVESINKDTPLLTIELTAKKNGLLKNVFGVSEIDESFILDADFNLIKIDGVIEGEIGVGFEDLDITLAVDVYPNPVVNNLILSIESEIQHNDVLFELYNMRGQRVLSAINTYQFDVNDLTSGMYIYKVTIDNKFISGRIMKE